jgi:hypothetical protein
VRTPAREILLACECAVYSGGIHRPLSLSHRGTSVASYPLKTLAANNIMRRRWPQRRSRDERIREDLISASLCRAMMINLSNKRARPYISEGKVGQADDGRHTDFIRQVNNGDASAFANYGCACLNARRRPVCEPNKLPGRSHLYKNDARTHRWKAKNLTTACVLRITRVARWPPELRKRF